MPHIQLAAELPGILGLFAFRAETAGPLRALSETLLRGPSPLSAAERELIAAHVSRLNECAFCFKSHAAAAGALLGLGAGIFERFSDGTLPASVSPKLAALLTIAAQVQRSGTAVSAETISAARAAGASDVEIHDTVLIAAAFCMFNRYVDGLGTWAPAPTEAYLPMGKELAEHGYVARRSQP
ncbi:MAG TPA: carboxymuconolactone decarboxylase family protein [Polyangiaceae bacterium]|nr:carboxymuconolactone decarboxylase family protein [Polyangiaceae bacterium]